VSGQKIGRTIDYRTANIKVAETYKLIPKDGVYIVSSNIDGNLIYGMMNIGANPTIPGKERSIEVHFFNFNDDLYNKNIRVSIYKRIRDELKFESVKALRDQLLIDEKTATDYIEQIK
jgi:riboflavin kinase/FMN adenylyltransferase